MKKFSFTLNGPSNPNRPILEVKVFALPDQTPRHQVHEKILHPYVQPSNPNSYTNSHFQHFILTSHATFVAKIIEGRAVKQAFVHIDPEALKIQVEQRFGQMPCSEGDIYEIVSCFSFKLGNQFVGLTITPDHSHVPRGRKPFILVKYLANNPTQPSYE